jgi:hypothetical protein
MCLGEGGTMSGREMSVDAFKPTASGTHKYTVVERLEEGDEVLIRLQHSINPIETA